MYNIDEKVKVEATVVGVTKNRDGVIEYELEVPDNSYTGYERVTLTDKQLVPMQN